MDSPVLVEADLERGRRVVSALDDNGVEVPAALWLYSSSSETWHLVIASPMVDREGSTATYRLIQSVLKKLSPTVSVPLRYVSVVSPNDALIRSLRTAVRTGRQLAEIRLRSSAFDGVYIEDAVIYRVE